jgi:hypothetical protein
MPIIAGTSRQKVWTGQYSFAVDGGTGAIVMRSNDGVIPSGSVLTGGVLTVSTAGNSADDTATVALHVQTANDIVSAAAVSGAPWSTTGNKDIILDSTGSTAITLTADRAPTLTVAVQDLDAGIFTLRLFYT